VSKSEADLKKAKDLKSKIGGKMGLETRQEQFSQTQEERKKLSEDQNSFLSK